MELDERRREFVRLLTMTERRLYGYIFTLAPDWNDADEILQETNIRLWEEFEKYEPGSNFSAWAMRVAYYQVLTWRKRAQRSRLVFDQRLLDQLSSQREHSEDLAEARHRVMGECLEELSDRSQQLLARFYAEGNRIKDIAATLGKSSESVYKAIQRLRVSLRHCIEERLAEEKKT